MMAPEAHHLRFPDVSLWKLVFPHERLEKSSEVLTLLSSTLSTKHLCKQVLAALWPTEPDIDISGGRRNTLRRHAVYSGTSPTDV